MELAAASWGRMTLVIDELCAQGGKEALRDRVGVSAAARIGTAAPVAAGVAQRRAAVDVEMEVPERGWARRALPGGAFGVPRLPVSRCPAASRSG